MAVAANCSRTGERFAWPNSMMERPVLPPGTGFSSSLQRRAHSLFRCRLRSPSPAKEHAVAPRPAWKGYLRISLVSMPVLAYTGSSGSTDEGSPIRFNQLHRECHSRIKYVKTCPIHGEVPNDEIVSGYEYAKGQYVEIDPDELAELRPEGERAISVEGFVHPDTIDPAYLSGKTYFLTPDGSHGQKPYQLIQEAMASEELNAIGRMKITTREHLVRVRAEDGLLIVDLLQYASQVKDPAQFKTELVDTHPTAPDASLPASSFRRWWMTNWI